MSKEQEKLLPCGFLWTELSAFGSRSPGEAAAAAAESQQQGAAHLYSSDISRTVH